MEKSTENQNVIVVEMENEEVVGAPPEDLFLLKPEERKQLKRAPKHGEELARALLEGLKKRPGIADLAGIDMNGIEEHVIKAEESTALAHQAFWQYRSLQDQALKSGHEYWTTVLKAWNVIKGAIESNPSIIADFSELHEHFSQHGAKVSAGKRQSQQKNSTEE